MSKWMNSLVKLVTLVSTLMLAFEQLRKILRDRRQNRQNDDDRRPSAA